MSAIDSEAYTPNPEASSELPLYHANNYQLMAERGTRQYWQESQMFAAEDGSMEVVITQRPLSERPEGDLQGVALARGEEDEVYENFRDCTALEEVSRGALGPLLPMFGLSIVAERDGQTLQYRVRVAGVDEMNESMDYIRTRTGFAPRIREFDGDKFKKTDLGHAAKEQSPLVATDPSLRLHDSVTHLPAWAVLTESLYADTGKHFDKLEHAVEEAGDHPEAKARAEKTLEVFLDHVDSTLSTATALLYYANGVIEGDKTAPANLLRQIKKLTGNPDDTTAKKHAIRLMNRVYRLRELALEQN